MRLLNLANYGSHEVAPLRVTFGLPLPWVSAANGNRLNVKIIHEADQFLKDVPALSFPLTHGVDPTYGDQWTGQVDIDPALRPAPGSAWGTPGTYVYRFELQSPLLDRPLDWIVDAFAREFGVGRQAAITLGFTDHPWDSAVEAAWRTPELRDLAVYEVMLNEFAADLPGVEARLPYLRDLGVNCLEIMPVANVDRTVDWGFEPVGLFGVDERFGNRRSFQRFVDAAHRNGIAVVLDMIYGHTGANFAYAYVYERLGYHQNPFIGPFGDADMFGPSADFNRQLTADFYFTANQYWLDRFRVDGIRYDCVPNYWDGAAGSGYASLVYETYQAVKATAGTGHWRRFFNGGGKMNLIQCAEQLQKPVEAIRDTYSNCTWQNGTLAAAQRVARGDRGGLSDLGSSLGLDGYPVSVTHTAVDTVEKTAFQYLENHDHPRFICNFGTDNLYRDVIREGRRENWFKLRPYVIGLLTAKGIPMLWEGQEIVEKYDVPADGPARIGTLRPVRWELFYDDAGRGMIRLVRKLLAIRNGDALFRRGEYHFHNNWDRWQSRGLLLFSRWDAARYALVALNFTDADQHTEFWFPGGGNYVERLEGRSNLNGVVAGQPTQLLVPSNYGCVWTN